MVGASGGDRLMGRVYCGPYAQQVGGHEGYAARLLPDETLTGTWTAETDEFVAYVSACGCGWAGETRHSPTDAGEDAALEEWDRFHLAPLISAAAREFWPRWVDALAERAARVADHIAAGDPAAAVELMRRIEDDVRQGRRVLDALVEEATR